MDTAVELAAARAAYRRHDWVVARNVFARVHNRASIGADDLYALGDCHWWLGDLDSALPVLQAAYRLALAERAPDRAARIALDVGYTFAQLNETAQSNGWMRRAYRAAAELPDHPIHGYLEYVEFDMAFDRRDLATAERKADAVSARGSRSDDPTLTALGVLAQGRVMVRKGEVAGGMAMLDEAMLAAVSEDLAPDWAGNIYCHLMAACEEIADLQRAQEWTTATARWCESLPGGSGPFMGICRLHRANLLQARGEWPEAQREAGRVLAHPDSSSVSIIADAHYLLGEIARQRGDLSTAEDEFRQAHELGRDPQPGLALLFVDRGDPLSAATTVRSALIAAGEDPAARAPLLPAVVETAVAVGDLETARSAADELAGLAARYRTAGFEAAAAHAEGRLLLAQRECSAALPVLRLALQRWQDVGAVIAAARVRADLELAYELLGDTDAAEREHRAVAAARSALAEQRRARPDASKGRLSPRESEILAKVAAGLSNQEIAAELFLSIRTVERHLATVYQKLGVGGRSARAAAVSFAMRDGLLERPRT